MQILLDHAICHKPGQNWSIKKVIAIQKQKITFKLVNWGRLIQSASWKF